MKKFEFGKVHCVDCLKVMKKLPDNSIDAVITNPSYGIGMDGGNVGYKGFNNFKKKRWDTQPSTREYFTEIMRISKQQIIWGGNYFQPPPFRRWLIWNKGAGSRTGKIYKQLKAGLKTLFEITGEE